MWLATKRPNSQNLCKRAYQAFKKAGYVEEARQPRFWHDGREYQDNIIMRFLSTDY